MSAERLHLPGFEPPTIPLQAGTPPARSAAPPPAAAPPPPLAPAPEVVAPDPEDPPFRIEVTRSAKRRRTVGAQLVGDVLRIAIPSWMSRAEEAHWVDEMGSRFRRKLSADRIDLAERARTLGRRYDLGRPNDIRWADDMRTRWGSCTPSTGAVRISTRIAKFPDWVIDYVIVHELAHLDVPGHGDDFWQIVQRYPRSERAIGYLIAKSGED